MKAFVGSNERTGCDARGFGYNLGELIAELGERTRIVVGAVEPADPDACWLGCRPVRHRRNVKALERLRSVVEHGREDERAVAKEAIARRHGQYALLRARRQATETQILREQVAELRLELDRAREQDKRQARKRLESAEDALLWRTNPAQAQRQAEQRKRDAEKARKAEAQFLAKVRANLLAYETQKAVDAEWERREGERKAKAKADDLLSEAVKQAQERVEARRAALADAKVKRDELLAAKDCSLNLVNAVAAVKAATKSVAEAEAALRERLAESCGCA